MRHGVPRYLDQRREKEVQVRIPGQTVRVETEAVERHGHHEPGVELVQRSQGQSPRAEHGEEGFTGGGG